MFTVTNSASGAVSVSGRTIPKLGSAEFDFLTTELIAAEAAGLVSIDPPPADTGGTGEEPTFTDLTDSTAGTPGNTLAACADLSTSDTYTDAAINAKIAILRNWAASMAAKINAIHTALENAGISVEPTVSIREVGSRLANLNYQGWSNDYAVTHRVN